MRAHFDPRAGAAGLSLTTLLLASACGVGPEDAFTPELESSEDSLAVLGYPMSGPATGISGGSCGAATEIYCAAAVNHCVVPPPFGNAVCTIDANSSLCKACIDTTFTWGVDCWSCLYGGQGGGSSSHPELPPAPGRYHSCHVYPSGPDDSSLPRRAQLTSYLGEECTSPVYDWSARRWTKRCCLVSYR